MEPRTEEELLEYRCATARIERAAAIKRLEAAEKEAWNAIEASQLLKMEYQSRQTLPRINQFGVTGLANRGH